MTDAPTARFTADQVRRRRAVALRGAVAAVVIVGLLFVVVFPVRSWLDQRAALTQSRHQLDVLREQRLSLEREARQLQSPAEIERLARARYGMVRPGEQAWAAVPGADPAPTTTTLPLAP